MTDLSELESKTETFAAYYETWARDIRAMNGHSVDADHADATASFLRALLSRVRELEKERDAARDYLIRNVIKPLHPRCAPLPDLLGVCSQIDNISTEIPQSRARLTALESERDALREALRPFVEATHDLIEEEDRDEAFVDLEVWANTAMKYHDLRRARSLLQERDGGDAPGPAEIAANE